MEQPELGNKIAELRKAKGLTQEELVAKCNLSVRTLQRIESGEATPRSYTVRLIFKALEYEITNLETFKPNISNYEIEPNSNKQKKYLDLLIDLFNLKKNTMKKLSILSVLTIGIILSISSQKSNAQCKEKTKDKLIGTTWHFVYNLTNNNAGYTDRILEFKNDMTFESRLSNGQYYNSGNYCLFNDSTFITIHSGTQTPNRYDFSIHNDTLHFQGTYLKSIFSSLDNKYYYQPERVDEVWVRYPVSTKNLKKKKDLYGMWVFTQGIPADSVYSFQLNPDNSVDIKYIGNQSKQRKIRGEWAYKNERKTLNKIAEDADLVLSFQLSESKKYAWGIYWDHKNESRQYLKIGKATYQKMK